MAQREYLKMADVFIEPLRVREKSPRLLDCCGALAANFLNEPGAKYAAHAINSHDELVEEIHRLRGDYDSVSLCWGDIERLVKALSWLGYSTPESKEEQAASQKRLIQDLIRAVESSRLLLEQQ